MTNLFSLLVPSRSSIRTFSKPHSSGSAKANDTATMPGSWILADGTTFSAKDDTLDTEFQDLNASLLLLSSLFPDVSPEVFREMLLNISPQSRTEIITEHLLRDKGKWVKGRYRTAGVSAAAEMVPKAEAFRSPTYRRAVKTALYGEFKSLSHSSIKSVLAERNFSYTASRPILAAIAARSWRAYFSRLWTRRGSTADVEAHPFVAWHLPFGEQGPRVPYLRRTESVELNEELYALYVQPVLERLRVEREILDESLARQEAEKEARSVGAMFECGCCYGEQVWEGMVVCSSGEHMICRTCVKNTMHEALFGQGWARTVDAARSTLRCLAPDAEEAGCFLPTGLVRQAILPAEEGVKVWQRFEGQVASRAMEGCNMPLEKCPFCWYAEVKETPEVRVRDVMNLAQSLAKATGADSLGTTAFLLAMHPLVLLYLLLWLAIQLLHAFAASAFAASHERVLSRRRGLRFKCLAANCSVASCSACHAKWTDPHICYETTTKSLRQAIEAATTAVVKRICPRCSTGFVKSTGCNKLVCPCGYAMCYICRSAIGSEGYAHFCQHFRAYGGKCSECNKCDLYAVEDEDAMIRHAAMQAEKDWREKQGVPVVDGSTKRSDVLGHVREEVLKGSRRGRGWNADDTLDAFLEVMLA